MDVSKTQITRQIQLNCSPDEAYRLITDKDNITRWYCDVVEEREGGLSFKWNMQDGSKIGFDVDIIEATSGKQFSYRSVGDFPTTTTFTLSAQGEHTQMTMTEQLHPDTPDLEALYDEHTGGWDWFFSRLQGLAE